MSIKNCKATTEKQQTTPPPPNLVRGQETTSKRDLKQNLQRAAQALGSLFSGLLLLCHSESRVYILSIIKKYKLYPIRYFATKMAGCFVVFQDSKTFIIIKVSEKQQFINKYNRSMFEYKNSMLKRGKQQ